MAYVKVGPWVNGGAPPISAANLDHVETQYDEAVADLSANPHGPADHNDRTRTVFLPANEAYISAGTPNWADQKWAIVEGGANVDEPSLAFTMKVPDDFVSFGSIKAVWMCGAAAGNMYWLMNAAYAASGENCLIHTDTPAVGVTATGGGGIVNMQEPANPLTLANLTLGDYIGIMFHRNGAHASDTLNAVVNLFGILFTYIADQ